MNVIAQHLSIDGKQYVLLPQAEYDKLRDRAGELAEFSDDELPSLPKPDRQGRFPAEEYAKISLARDLIRSRRQARLSQQQLANLAGIRQETLSRIETGKHKASIRTIEKIEQALGRAAKRH
jgi:DNA-binding XRE family transcriptional regulator